MLNKAATAHNKRSAVENNFSGQRALDRLRHWTRLPAEFSWVLRHRRSMTFERDFPILLATCTSFIGSIAKHWETRCDFCFISQGERSTSDTLPVFTPPTIIILGDDGDSTEWNGVQLNETARDIQSEGIILFLYPPTCGLNGTSLHFTRIPCFLSFLCHPQDEAFRLESLRLIASTSDTTDNT